MFLRRPPRCRLRRLVVGYWELELLNGVRTGYYDDSALDVSQLC